MKKSSPLQSLLVALFLLALIPAAHAATPEQPSAESRKAMVEAHRKMADCLASNKPIKECRKEMHAMHSKMGCECREESGEKPAEKKAG